ncbi:MAG: hypothetical protein ACE149_05555 [Armatimonadota bacterium]
MPTVQCPSCGATNPNGRRLLARCRICHVNLAACRYCRFYAPSMMDCTHPARPDWLRITDPNEALNCPDFASIGVGPRLTARQVIRTALIAAPLALIAMLAVVHFYRAATRSGPAVPLRATVSAPAETTADAGFPVRVLVANQGEHPADGVQVTIVGKSIRDLTCQGIEPPECYVEATPRRACARIKRIEPGAIATVTFYFAPREPGEVKLVAQVSAENSAAPERVPVEAEILP